MAGPNAKPLFEAIRLIEYACVRRSDGIMSASIASAPTWYIGLDMPNNAISTANSR